MGRKDRSVSTKSTSGGVDIARLILRGAVGGTILAHGVKHAKSLEGTARWFGSIGFREPEIQAKISAGVEIGAGAALLAGIGTPVAAAAVIGTLTTAAGSVHIPNGFFITSEGYEYVLTLSAAAAALAALGPGPLSLDRALGVHEVFDGRTRGLGAIALGVVGALGHLKMFWTKPAPKE